MSTKFTPLHDRILVRRVEEVGTTRGGIIIPDSAKDKPSEGEVISVGRGKSNDEGKVFPLAVKEGDHISVRQVLRHGDQAGRRRFHHHARGRGSRRGDGRGYQEGTGWFAQVTAIRMFVSRFIAIA